MKWFAVIVLFAISLGVAVPPSLPIAAVRGGEAELGVLDLCHAGTPALSSNGDMPCMNGCPCRLPAPALYETAGILVTPRKPLLLTYQDERPPKA
jgi:hypothetical protein